MGHIITAPSVGYEDGIRIPFPGSAAPGDVLSGTALDFLAMLERRFGARRRALLALRSVRQARIDAGESLGFSSDSADLRAASWRAAAVPSDLLDRRVEITGPTNRKMVINGLNSGARVFMADFEDSHSPGWEATLQGQVNISDAIRRTIEFHGVGDKLYRLNQRTATLMVRPRGFHLEEKHCLVDDKPISASFFDFGLFIFRNARELLDLGSGPYLYLPKLESRQEARLWNDVLADAERTLGLPMASIRATVLIETLPAVFEMDEIIYELRERCVGLNCGRWDYIFSMIKTFASRADFIMPDRSSITMASPFLRAYSRRLIEVSHRRGIHAMGGMAAQIPIKGDSAANDTALNAVRADKEREAAAGHDGTWVAHPGLVATATSVFDRVMPEQNQLDRLMVGPSTSAAELLERPVGPITAEGLRLNISVGLQYLASWLSGSGCVPIRGLMEDAATAEISRSQVWQWIHHHAVLDDGRAVTTDLFHDLLSEEVISMNPRLFADGKLAQAAELLDAICSDPHFTDFITVPAYGRIE